MYKYLNKFNSKMQWIGVAESIITKVNNTQKFNDQFNNYEMINIIFTILHFIMEKTLSEDKNCTIKNISSFLSKILYKYYNKNLDEEYIQRLVRFIIIEVLLNNGQPYNYISIDYKHEKNPNYSIRIKLIEDFIIQDSITKESGYMLSKQGFEFLFRIDDIEEELEISIEQIRLKELLKRKKFSKALEQCKMMVNRIRQKRKDIELFIRRIKQNINDVNLEECNKIIDSTFSLLNEEFRNYNSLYNMIKEIEKNILDKLKEDKNNDEFKNYQKDIENIRKSIRIVLDEYHSLFRSQHPIRKIYNEALENSLLYTFRERIDIEKDILEKAEGLTENIRVDNLSRLFNPIFRPWVDRHLNIFKIYDEQNTLIEDDENEDDEGIDIKNVDNTDDSEEVEIEEINNKYLKFIKIIFDILVGHEKEINLSQLLELLKNEDVKVYEEIISDKLFYKTLLILYDIGTINADEILQESKSVISYKTKDFNAIYIFGKIFNNINYTIISKFEVEKENNEIITINYEEKDTEISYKHEVTISNFKFKVVL